MPTHVDLNLYTHVDIGARVSTDDQNTLNRLEFEFGFLSVALNGSRFLLGQAYDAYQAAAESQDDDAMEAAYVEIRRLENQIADWERRQREIVRRRQEVESESRARARQQDR